MTYRQNTPAVIDITVGGRIFNGCWSITCVGIAIFQMRLLAQTWQLSHLAFWTACVASSWIIGAIVVSLLGTRRQRAPRLWGVSFVLCTLVWTKVPFALTSPSSSLSFSTILHAGEFAIMALLMGLLSTGWLIQKRPWPAVGERTALARSLLSTMIGLATVWIMPAWADATGLLCLLPLLILDFWPAVQCPLPMPGKLIDSWYDTSEGADRWQLQLSSERIRGWGRSYLAQRNHGLLILLASGSSVLLGSIWSAVPTPFASGLFDASIPFVLGLLVLGQLVAFGIGMWYIAAAKNILGVPARLIPQEWRGQVYVVAVVMLFLMGCSLWALGWPTLQAPGYLTLSLAIYTLAGVIWGILLPRLKPGVGTMMFVQRHLLTPQWNTGGQIAYERAQEEYVNRLLLTIEGLLTALFAPLVGWLVDCWSVDGVLIVGGIALFIFLGGSLLATNILQRDGSNKLENAYE